MSRTTNRILLFASIALTATLATAPQASAAPLSVGYTLQITEALPNASLSTTLQNTQTLVAADRPMFTLSNNSDAAEITGFSITMENQTYSFGSLIFMAQDSEVQLTSYSPITTPGQHADVQTAGLSFSNFEAGDQYGFRTDIDRTADHGASLTNYRQALASGAKANWAQISVTFSDGTTLSKSLTPADVSGGSASGTYSYFYCIKDTQPTGQILVNQQFTPVAEPSTLVLAGLGLAGTFVGAARARRRRGHEQAAFLTPKMAV
jgi:hypothetical protein